MEDRNMHEPKKQFSTPALQVYGTPTLQVYGDMREITQKAGGIPGARDNPANSAVAKTN